MNSKIALSVVATALLVPATFADTYALCIGIADYPEATDSAGKLLKDSNGKPISMDLNGCVNDATSIRDTLISKFSVPSSNIELLSNSMATEAGLLAAIKTLALKFSAGDTFVFFFSGHGTQIPTKDKVAEPDGLDEAFVLYDCLVSDKSIRGLSDALLARGVSTTFVIDSCFSGGMSRTTTRLTKSLTYKEAMTMAKRGVRTLPKAAVAAPKAGAAMQGASSAFLTAGREDQPTVDLTFKGGVPAHGAFTLFLVDALGTSPSSGLESLIIAVRKGLLSFKLDQVPQLEVSDTARSQESLVPLPPAYRSVLDSPTLAFGR